SASFRLFLAIKMFRRFANRPKPFSSCCCTPTTSDDDTSGLKKLAVGELDARVLFHATVAVVPVENPSVRLLVYVPAWEDRVPAIGVAAVPVPVPEMNGLLIGVLRSSKEICV